MDRVGPSELERLVTILEEHHAGGGALMLHGLELDRLLLMLRAGTVTKVDRRQREGSAHWYLVGETKLADVTVHLFADDEPAEGEDD